MCGNMVDIQSPTTEIRRGKKEERQKKSHDENIMSASAIQGGHNNMMLHCILSDIILSRTILER